MPLSFRTKVAYGAGHFFNDLCSTMWFTYLLIFFSNVMQFSSSLAGAVALVGQIADGLATPFIGYFSDRIASDRFWFCKYGRRKIWHLIGSVLTILTYPFIFSPCPGCQQSETWVQMVYYSVFVTLFQIAWATVQIAHLSLVPDLTPDKHQRTSLLALRNVATVVSAMLVYVLMWAVLRLTRGDPDAPISPSDAAGFQILTYTVVAVGTVFTVFFHLGVRENPAQSDVFSKDYKNSEITVATTNTSILSSFKQIKFYQVAVIYMTSRLFANLSQTIFPLYLHDYLKLGGQYVAILPLVMYTLGFLISLVIKSINKKFGRKIAFILSAALGIGVSIWVLLADGSYYKKYNIFIVAGIYGISSSAMLVTSLGVTADLIGQDSNNGAFIYGIMSFCDKISNGAAVMAIQYWEDEWGYRNALAYSCGVSALLGTVTILSLKTIKDSYQKDKNTLKDEVNNGLEVSHE